MRRNYSGYNKDTAKHLLLDAGAVLVNYDIEKTFDEQRDKLLGATSGGNTFEATPEYREVEVDGVKGKAKGLSILQSWEVSLKVNMLEFREKTYEHALSAVRSEEVQVGDKDYQKIQAENYVTLCHYLDNVTLIATVSGSNDPVIIQVYNVLNTEGLSIDFADGDDIVAEITFEGHYDADNLENPPFAIYYPKEFLDDEDCEEDTPGK